jgi:hypothetical protein
MSYLTAERTDDTAAKTSGFFCIQDAKQHNETNIQLYTLAERQYAEQLKARAQVAYPDSRVYLNYKKNFIGIKIEKPSPSDKVGMAVARFDDFCTERNIIKKPCGKNLMYRYTTK